MTAATNSSHVPVVDISDFDDGTASDRRAVVDGISAACEQIGFLTIAGHGVPERIVDEARAVALGFFHQPPDVKARSAAVIGIFRGYRGLESTSLAASLGEERPADLKEFFIIGPESGDHEYYSRPEAGALFADTPWPASPEDFQRTIARYYATMESLGERIRRILATALDLPSDWFEDKWDKHTSNLSLVHYPARDREPLPGQLRAGAHADYGSYTLLSKDDGAASLQVLLKSGEWADVVPPKGTFVFNIGDQLARWTNDRWVSTKHRVINPRPGEGERLSMAFFCQPNYDAIVSPIPSCVTDDNPARYEPATAGDILYSGYSKSAASELE